MDIDFIPPKDAVILAEESHHALGDNETGIRKYRVVYETVQKELRGKKLMQDGKGGRVIVEEMNDPEADFGSDDTALMMLDGTSLIPPVRKVSGGDTSDSTVKDEDCVAKKPRLRSGKHALNGCYKKPDRGPKCDKRYKERRSKNDEKDRAVTGREQGRKPELEKQQESKEEKERGRDRREKNRRERERKKDKKHTDKEKKDKSSLRNAFASVINTPSQSPLLTPPSPGSRRKTPQTDYFSAMPDSHQDPPYTASLKRSSSVTRTSTSSIHQFPNSRRGSFVTSRQDTIQAQTSSGTQLRRQYSREFLPGHNTISDPALMSTPPTTPQPWRAVNSPYTAPSIHTLRTTHSQTSLSLHFISAGDISARDDMMGRSYYPHDHLCRNMSKFMRFSSASYGSNFMRFLGIGAAASTSSAVVPARPVEHHAEHHAFSFHTSVPVDTILLSSFTDPEGGYDMYGDVNTGVPLVHYICVDHKAKAVVLTCRGTLGLDDVVTDLTCEYGDVEVRGKTYKVHKGMLNSALLLLKTRRAKVLMTIRDALQEHEGYGLVLCGHSLGGGVASILSILLSKPTTRGGFVTSNTMFQDVYLPEGRPIHCYAYGSPACVCSKLRLETRGLITSVVYGRDIVPSLSFGMIQDFHSVALAFKEDRQGIRREIGKTVIGNLTRKATGFGNSESICRPRGSGGNGEENYENGADPRIWASGDVIFEDRDDEYLYSILKTLRAGMDSQKLVPPGEVYLLETQTVFQQERDGGVDIKPATRVTTRIVKDVEKRFGEIGFGRGMFSDHSPANYEGALELLLRGVCDEEVEFT